MKGSSVGHPDDRNKEEPPTCSSLGHCWVFTALGVLTLSGGVPPAECLHGQRRAPPHTRACLHVPAHARMLFQPLPFPPGQGTAEVMASPSNISKEAVH